jgi:hypothetical protein
MRGEGKEGLPFFFEETRGLICGVALSAVSVLGESAFLVVSVPQPHGVDPIKKKKNLIRLSISFTILPGSCNVICSSHSTTSPSPEAGKPSFFLCTIG